MKPSSEATTKDIVSSFKEEAMYPLKLKEHPDIWYRIKDLQQKYQ